MNLTYERQWKEVEKLIDKEVTEKNEYKYYDLNDMYNVSWNTKKSIVMFVFNIYQYLDWNELWKFFESGCYTLHLNDWEYQQKPLLDKMIETTLYWHTETTKLLYDLKEKMKNE